METHALLAITSAQPLFSTAAVAAVALAAFLRRRHGNDGNALGQPSARA